MDTKLWQAIWQSHSGRIVGVTAGLLIGIFIIAFGFFRTLFVLICVSAGYVVGKRIDEKEDITDILDRLLPPGHRR